jgi:hypothetical protein
MDAPRSPMILRRLSAFGFTAALCAIASAHIGSPNVLFDGTAGPYAVRVIVRPPEVVPGRAEVTVRVDAPDVEHVVIRPVFWRAGVAGAPAGDDLRRIDGQERVYNGQLWLMSYGAYSVYVTVSGARGSGTAIVPVNSFATGRLPLSRGLGAILVVLARRRVRVSSRQARYSTRRGAVARISRRRSSFQFLL